MHVPPSRFVRIRHYDLLCSRNKNKKPALCRNLLGCKKYLSKLKSMNMPELLDHQHYAEIGIVLMSLRNFLHLLPVDYSTAAFLLFTLIHCPVSLSV